MMRRLICLFVLLAVTFLPDVASAQTGPLVTEPPTLTVTGTLEHGVFAASLRLIPSRALTDVQIVVSDLNDATGGSYIRDPLPASSVTLLPTTDLITVTQDSLTQVIVQVTPPPTAGIYTGTLLIHWTGPEPGQLCVPLTIVARTRPSLAFQGSAQVTINGARGDQVSRQVTLRETTSHGSPLTGLRAVPQDLHAAGGQALEANRLHVSLPDSQIAGGRLLTATLEIDMKGLAPGTYTGQVFFESDTATPLSLPVTVNVRHKPIGPMIVLLLGVGAGLYLSTYKTKGKPRAKLILRIVAVRQELEKEAGPQAGFRSRIEFWLGKAEAATHTEEWDVAETAVQHAEELKRKWYAGDWQTQITYLQELRESRLRPLAEADEAVTPKVLLQQAQNALETVADLDTPAALREKTIAIEAALAHFEGVKQQYEEINQVRSRAPDALNEKKEIWRLKLQSLQRQITQLPPDDSAWEKVEQDLQALGEEMIQEIETAQPSEGAYPTVKGAPLGRGDAEETVARLKDLLLSPFKAVQQPPDSGPFTLEDARRAQEGRTLFDCVIYSIGGLVLAALGYGTLYQANPSFGAQSVNDYLALLAWGLGAQTTFTSVAGLLRGLDIPLRKGE
jgi:hypothetical protein